MTIIKLDDTAITALLGTLCEDTRMELAEKAMDRYAKRLVQADGGELRQALLADFKRAYHDDVQRVMDTELGVVRKKVKDPWTGTRTKTTVILTGDVKRAFEATIRAAVNERIQTAAQAWFASVEHGRRGFRDLVRQAVGTAMTALVDEMAANSAKAAEARVRGLLDSSTD